MTRIWSGVRLRLLRGVAQSAFPSGLVYQVSLYGSTEKRPSSSYKLCWTERVFSFGWSAHKRLDYEPLTTITYKAVGQPPSQVFSRRCQYKLSCRRACCLLECTKYKQICLPRGCSWRVLVSFHPWTSHTLLYYSTRTDSCTPSPFVDHTTPTRKGERPQGATSMCVHVCVLCHCCTGQYVRAPYLLRLQPTSSQATDLERRAKSCFSG